MKIVIATPLYPPDIAQPAPYVKELATRLVRTYNVTIVAYARIPENIPGVSIIVVSKRRHVLMRLFFYMRALWDEAKKSDILYLENGASVMLPASLVAFFLRKPLILHFGDIAAHQRDRRHIIYAFIEKFAQRSAQTILTDLPRVKPEIFPFHDTSSFDLSEYENSWSTHLALLDKTFQRYAKHT